MSLEMEIEMGAGNVWRSLQSKGARAASHPAQYFPASNRFEVNLPLGLLKRSAQRCWALHLSIVCRYVLKPTGLHRVFSNP